MAALARLAQVVHRATGDDFAAMPQEGVEQFTQTQEARLAIDQADHVDTEHGLERRVLVEIVEHDVRHFIALQLNDDAQPILIGLVAQTVRTDAIDDLLAHEIGDALKQACLVDLIREFGDDDLLAATLEFLDVAAGTDVDTTATGLVGRDDLRRTVDDAARREIRSRHDLHDLRQRDLGSVDHRDAGIHHLAEIVRRDIRGHTDGDTGGTVDE